jgi:hypothetical protein
VSADTNVRQLLAFANAAGQELARDYNWTALQKRMPLSVLPGVASYSLPMDCLRMIPETLWGQNTWRSGYGGPTAAQWESLLTWQPAATLRLLFRIQGESLEFTPTPATAFTVTLAYQSSWWAGAVGETLSSETLSASITEPVYDRRLMVTAIKVRYLEARGFDSVAARLDYERAVSRAMGADGVSPGLTIGGSRGGGLAGWRNLPPTGWGQ